MKIIPHIHKDNIGLKNNAFKYFYNGMVYNCLI